MMTVFQPLQRREITTMAPKTLRREMSDAEKGAILVLYYLFYTYATISFIVGRPFTTVRSFILRTLERGSKDNAPRSGRPTKLSKRERRAISRYIKRYRTATREEVRKYCAPHVSLRTIDRYTRTFNMKRWLARERPKLTTERAAKRLAWAKEHRHWTAEDFKKVLWSDECSIEKSATGAQTWVWRLPSEKWDKDCIAPKKKGNGTSLMVWGCFWGNQRGTFVPLVVHSVDSYLYRRLCKFLVLPVLEHMERVLGTKPYYQQDNAPVHKAKILKAFFKRHKVELAEHPPYSPDLNPIEHVWVILKRRLAQRYPELATYPGGPEAVRARMAEVLPGVWDSLGPDVFEPLWQSMPDRVAAVIRAKGWYTRY